MSAEPAVVSGPPPKSMVVRKVNGNLDDVMKEKPFTEVINKNAKKKGKWWKGSLFLMRIGVVMRCRIALADCMITLNLFNINDAFT